MARGSEATITTWSGRHIDLLDPEFSINEIRIDDIAASLTKTHRFTGHTYRPYTVAEHLLLGVDYLNPEHRFKWFTHDFSEAYLGDVAGPMKRMLSMQFYRDLEAGWERALAQRFGIGAAGAKEVKAVDGRMLVTEQRDLMGRQPLSTDRRKPFAMHIGLVAPSQDWLMQNFLSTFYALALETEGALI